MGRAAQRVEERVPEARVFRLLEVVSPDVKPFVYARVFDGCAVDALAQILRYAGDLKSMQISVLSKRTSLCSSQNRKMCKLLVDVDLHDIG